MSVQTNNAHKVVNVTKHRVKKKKKYDLHIGTKLLTRVVQCFTLADASLALVLHDWNSEQKHGDREVVSFQKGRCYQNQLLKSSNRNIFPSAAIVSLSWNCSVEFPVYSQSTNL